ncbi:MAG: AAA family ATPase [Verrucomicrobiota bacterium]
MRLKKVTLTNFRCFDRLELELHERLTVIVADNGGGKTSILDGIAVGLSQVLRYLSSANQRLTGPGFKDTDFRLVPKKVKDEVRWVASDYAQVVVETFSGLRWDNSKVSGQKTRKPVYEKVGSEQLADAMAGVFKTLTTDEPAMIPVFAYYGANRGSIAVPERLRESKTKYDYPTSALLGALSALGDFKEMLKWFDAEEARELRMNRAYKLEIKVPPETQERHLWVESGALTCVRTSIERVLGGTYSDPMIDRNRKFVIHSDTDPRVLQISQLSQGYQSMLAIGMDFARRLALANPLMQHDDKLTDSASPVRQYVQKWMGDIHDKALIGPTWAPAVMLIDEIDLHLHPSWQQRVLGDLMRAFPGTQFIVTTHSAQVLTTVRKENIRIIEKDGDGKWGAKMPEHSPLSQESGDALASVMGVNPIPVRSESQRELLDIVHDYEQLIRGGMEGEAPAMAVKAKLDAAGYEIPEASLALWRFMGEKVKQRR